MRDLKETLIKNVEGEVQKRGKENVKNLYFIDIPESSFNLLLGKNRQVTKDIIISAYKHNLI